VIFDEAASRVFNRRLPLPLPFSFLTLSRQPALPGFDRLYLKFAHKAG
jgi:hypothetical protein